jgi:ASPM-SPD-2-Hydin domain-containing protein
MNRSSESEWSGSRYVTANGSAKTVAASWNETLSFLSFCVALPGAHSKFTVLFYPDARQLYNVAVVDPTVPNPGLCVTPNTGWTFGGVPLGATSNMMLTITSCGGDPLSVSSASTNSSDFSIPVSKNGCIGTLPIGQSCTLDVQFTPSTAGSESSFLTIDSNSPIPVELDLSGIGTTPPVMSLSAASLTLGPQLVGTESAPQTITLTNTGNATLNGIFFGMLAIYEPIFPLTSTCGPALSPGASCTFTVAFRPASTGTTATTLTVGNNSGLPFQQVSRSGTSPQSPFVVGSQTAGSMTSTVTDGNTATYALKITPAGGYSGSVSLACSSLPANAICVFVPSPLALSGATAANFTLSILIQSAQTISLLGTAGGWAGHSLGFFSFCLGNGIETASQY